MRIVSAGFREAVLSSHKMAVVVRPRDSEESVPVTEGSVTLDGAAAIRGTCTLTVNDPAWAPLAPGDVLAPYGNEVEIFRGIDYGGGDTELVPLGIFGIQQSSTQEDSGGGVTISLTAADRAQKVIDALFEADYTVAGGTDYLTALKAIISDGLPGATYNFESRTLTTGTVIASRGEDRWELARAMATFIGMELFFDNEGICVLRTITDAAAAPVAYLVEGQEVAVYDDPPSLISAEKVLTRADAHNKWIVVGNNPDDADAPPVGSAIDDDPLSPTYYYGEFGKKPEIFTSSLVTTTTQAEDAAAGKKAKESGLARGLSFGALVDPSLEPGDVVRITRTVRGSDGTLVELADEDHVIDSLAIPLGVDGVMTGQSRASRVPQ